jgi:hypothetical protein
MRAVHCVVVREAADVRTGDKGTPCTRYHDSANRLVRRLLLEDSHQAAECSCVESVYGWPVNRDRENPVFLS